MSPSRLDVAQRCLALFRYRYVDPQPNDTPSGWKRAFGAAMDSAANEVYEHKYANHRTVPASDAADRFAAAWEVEAETVGDWEGAKRGAVLDTGVEGAKLWRDNIAQWVQPTQLPQLHVEREVVDAANYDVWTLHGYIDVIGEVQGTTFVTDLKTSARRYSESSMFINTQPAAYTWLTQTPAFSYHVVTNTKQPQTQVLQGTVDASTQDLFLRRAGMLRRQVRAAYMSGDWLPNRQHVLCSRKYCEQWQRCAKDFGGEVKA